MKKIAYIVASFLIMTFIAIGLSGVKSDALEEKCEIPSSAVKITVKKERDEPIYEYTVTNLHDNRPIFLFSIGKGPKGMLRGGFPELVPVNFVSPEGWEGEVGGAENPDTFYFWSVDMDKYEDYASFEIAPGKTVSGFKIVMTKPLDIMMALPFMARFGVECAYGTVVAE